MAAILGKLGKGPVNFRLFSRWEAMRRILVGVVVSYFEVEYMEVAVHNLSLRHHYLKLDNLKQITQFSNAKHVLDFIISLLLHTNCLRDNSHPICIFAVFTLVQQNWFLCTLFLFNAGI